MAVPKRIEIKGKDTEGNDKVVYLELPNAEANKEAQLAYNKAFRDALQSGAILRQKLNQVMEDQGIWNEDKENQYNEVLAKINEGEKKLSKGGISLSEARSIAIEMRENRVEFRSLIAERSAMDGNTAEGQADNERFAHLLYACLKNENGKRLFPTREEYDKAAASPYIVKAAGELAEKVYGLDPNYEKNLPENKFLQAYKFTDQALRLINEDGHLIDIDNEGVQRLIDEGGRFIDYDKEGEKFFVDKDGNRVTEEGEYEEEFSPFLDDKGKPIAIPGEEEEQPEEEVVAEETKPKRTPRKRTTKKAQAKATTE
tara:strand:+ start:10056 stop:10997 length:942 start_codon:yes stop_codon:yes gene_type:complete